MVGSPLGRPFFVLSPHTNGIPLPQPHRHPGTPHRIPGAGGPGGGLHNERRHGVDDLIRKGRDLEKPVLAEAVRWHLEGRVLVYGNKTVVFD